MAPPISALQKRLSFLVILFTIVFVCAFLFLLTQIGMGFLLSALFALVIIVGLGVGQYLL